MDGYIIGKFYQGPYDGEQLLLPTPEPWPKFVIPKFGSVTIEFFYLLAGPLDENIWAYLFDDSFAGIAE